MVKRPMYTSRDANNKSSKGVTNSNANGHNRTMVNGNATNVKQTIKKNGSVSRSKSMSGLNRVDANKINGNSDGKLKSERSPLVQSSSSHSLRNGTSSHNGSYTNLTIKGNE